MKRLLAAAAVLITLPIAATPLSAASFVFTTPAGSSGSDGPLAAEADVTTGAGTIDIILKNLLSPSLVNSAGQTVSDLSIVLDGAPGALTARSATGQLANIGSDGGVTDISGDPLRWVGLGPAPPNGSGTFTITGNTILMEALGGGQPSQLLLPSGTSFAGAAASIVGGQFNPFVVDGPLSIHLGLAGVTANTQITQATFSFGTGPETFITVPGPALGAGIPGIVAGCLGLIGLARRRRRTA